MQKTIQAISMAHLFTLKIIMGKNTFMFGVKEVCSTRFLSTALENFLTPLIQSKVQAYCHRECLALCWLYLPMAHKPAPEFYGHLIRCQVTPTMQWCREYYRHLM